jgi:hypothetical protein
VRAAWFSFPPLGPWGDLGPDYWPEPENAANWRQPFQPPHEPPWPGDLPVGELPASGLDYEQEER